MIAALAFGAALMAAYFGVAGVRAWSERRKLFDIPNERSSHVEPTPSGGGVAIVVVTLTFYLSASYIVPGTFSWGYFAGAMLIASISLIDDVYTIPMRWRLLTHAGAAVLLIADRGWWHFLYLPGFDVFVDLHAAGAVLTFLWIVGLVTAYNFMDGIDGMAGVQAVVAAAGWMAVGWLTGSAAAFYLGGALLFSSLGFLIHNWQPARIFMGDVGSAFLGFSFAAIPLLANTGVDDTDKLLPTAAVLFVWFFVFDGVVTFIRRAFREAKPWRPHREHLYQRLVLSGLSHAAVSTLYGVLAFAIGAGVIGMFSVRTQTAAILMIIDTALCTTVLLGINWRRKNSPTNDAKDAK